MSKALCQRYANGQRLSTKQLLPLIKTPRPTILTTSIHPYPRAPLPGTFLGGNSEILFLSSSSVLLPILYLHPTSIIFAPHNHSGVEDLRKGICSRAKPAEVSSCTLRASPPPVPGRENQSGGLYSETVSIM